MNIKGGMDVENDMKQPTAQEELAYINQLYQVAADGGGGLFLPGTAVRQRGGPGL